MRRTATALALGLSCVAHAGVTHFPGEGAFGTLLLEDQFPCAGDRDFNDAVLRYNVRSTGELGQTEHLTLSVEVAALGATLRSGLAWRLPVDPAGVTATVRVGDPGGVPWGDAVAAEVSDAGGQAVVWLSDDLRADLCDDAEGFLNTDPEAPVTACRPLRVEVTLAAPATLPPLEPWDLFAFRTDRRDLQVHRSRYYGLPAGSAYAANTSVFGTCGDGSDPAPGSGGSRWYVQGPGAPVPGLPFVLLVGEGGSEADAAGWAAEQVQIERGMPGIVAFASSHGASSTDWYEAGLDPEFLFDGVVDPPVAPDGEAYDPDLDGYCVGVDHDGLPGTPPECFGGVGLDDCAPLDPTRYPGAVDTFGNAFDEDCDQADGVDADGDGNASPASGGADCNDADPAIHLGTSTCPAVDCDDLLARFPARFEADGVYSIRPTSTTFSAVCDMTTDGGGWTVFEGVNAPWTQSETACATTTLFTSTDQGRMASLAWSELDVRTDVAFYFEEDDSSNAGYIDAWRPDSSFATIRYSFLYGSGNHAHFEWADTTYQRWRAICSETENNCGNSSNNMPSSGSTTARIVVWRVTAKPRSSCDATAHNNEWTRNTTRWNGTYYDIAFR